ncbi:MAG: hypothetical protein IPM83_16045 [Ignavibacteria bacterium]|nr:hypothetical protein [Ignavibacteria bacterium]
MFPEFLQASDGMYTACRILDMLAQTDHQLRNSTELCRNVINPPCRFRVHMRHAEQ